MLPTGLGGLKLGHARIAASLGARHEILSLTRVPGRRSWACDDGEERELEEAALSVFVRNGWTGHAQEGGLVLSLIKAASFVDLPPRHASVFVEALYAQNMAALADKVAPRLLIETVRKANAAQIAHNLAIMTRLEWGRNGAPGCQWFPTVSPARALSLYVSLGNERLAAIAEVFARAPYVYRAGWPDLTLWRDGEVAFREIKSPGDKLHASQRRLICDLLLPLGFDVAIVDVVC